MVDAAVRFLLVERDAVGAQVRDGFQDLKIANPLLVIQSPTDVMAFLRIEPQSSAPDFSAAPAGGDERRSSELVGLTPRPLL
jgi:hypothetical protein